MEKNTGKQNRGVHIPKVTVNKFGFLVVLYPNKSKIVKLHDDDFNYWYGVLCTQIKEKYDGEKEEGQEAD